MKLTDEQRETAERAAVASAAMARLRNDPDFCRRYAAGDAGAAEAYEALIETKAAGVTARTEAYDLAGQEALREMGVTLPTGNESPEALATAQAQLTRLTSDPEFAAKIAAGDLVANRAFNAAIYAKATASGIPAETIGQAEAGPSGTGAEVLGGGA